MPCCSCNGRRALCRGCSCAKGKKGCTDCYPGRKGKCVNTSIAAPPTSSQPLPRVPSPSCSSAEHASQPSLPTPPQTLEHDSSALPPCVKVVGRGPPFAYWRKVGLQAYTKICSGVLCNIVVNIVMLLHDY